MALPISPSIRNRLLALLLIGACTFLAASPRPWHGAVRGSVHAAAHAPQAALADAHDALQHALGRLRTLWHATDEVQRLRQENRALREALARRDAEAQKSTARLRDFAAFDDFRRTVPSGTLRIVPADVVGADTSSWRHSVVVDRGSADGIRLGTPAVWGNSIVGTVVALRAGAATVRLLDDSQAGLKVAIARTGDVGLLHGETSRDGLLRLKWHHLSPALQGDLVVTTYLDTSIPPGLVAGQVVHASQTRDHLFYDVRVRPLIDLDRLTELLLVVYRPADVEELLQEPPR